MTLLPSQESKSVVRPCDLLFWCASRYLMRQFLGSLHMRHAVILPQSGSGTGSRVWHLIQSFPHLQRFRRARCRCQLLCLLTHIVHKSSLSIHVVRPTLVNPAVQLASQMLSVTVTLFRRARLWSALWRCASRSRARHFLDHSMRVLTCIPGSPTGTVDPEAGALQFFLPWQCISQHDAAAMSPFFATS